MNTALVIGINQYAHVRPLQTACGDALAVADLLEARHAYRASRVLDSGATLAGIRTALAGLRQRTGPDDRVLLYFAGHGIALEAEDRPAGYLVPQDAKADDPSTLLSMGELNASLEQLQCRHLLLILDCCFGGAFRWSTSRDVKHPPRMFQERYLYLLREPAWQVLTSSAHDELAVDVIASRPVGKRDPEGARHSPFCQTLLEGLTGAADSAPSDGVISASELYLHILGPLTGLGDAAVRQTPGLWPLPKHRKGEFLFLNPERQLQLPSAPDISQQNNPYRGLASYDINDQRFFFGRAHETERLLSSVERSPLVAVVGSSGTGKSSLLKAGVIARLDRDRWEVLPVLRPGRAPLEALARAVQPLAGGPVVWTPEVPDLLSRIVAQWRGGDPARAHRKVLVTVDQLEELVTLCANEADRLLFLDLLARALAAGGCSLACTARIDFEAHFWSGPLRPWWREGRHLLGPIPQDGLREVIERPAAESAIFFESPELVERIINEVVAVPGALPLLSFTLSELYLSFLKAGAPADRTFREQAYDDLGGVAGALWRRANEFYESLSPPEQRTLRWVMLRMVSLEGGRQSRRQLHDSERNFPSPEQERILGVLDRMVQARLILRHDESYEPAHDALVLSWWRVQHWLREEQEQLVTLRRMTEAAMDWRRERKKGTWHDDPRLDVVAQRLAEQPERFNSDERAFILSSVAHRRRLARRWIAAGVALILTLAGGVTATWRQNQKLSESLAASLYGTSHEQAELQNDSTASVLLAARAIQQAPSDDPRLPVYIARALQLVSRAPLATRNLGFQADQGALSGDLGRVLLLRGEDGKDPKLLAWDVRAGQELKVPTLSPGERLSDVQPVVSRDGQWAALITFTPDSARLRAWNLETGKVTVDDPIEEPTTANVSVGEDVVTRLGFSADGILLVLKHGLDLRRWEVSTAQELEQQDFVSSPVPGALAVAQGEGARSWTVRVKQGDDCHSEIEVLDLRTGAPPSPKWKPITVDGQIFSVAFSPGGHWVAAVFSSASGVVGSYGPTGEDLVLSTSSFVEEEPHLPAPPAREDREQPLQCDRAFLLKIWNAATGEPANWAGNLGDTEPFRLEDISLDGKRLLTVGAFPENEAAHGLRLWLADESAYYALPVQPGRYPEARLGGDDRMAITLSGNRELRVWDAALGRQTRPPENLSSRWVALALAENRREIAFITPNGLLLRRSLEDERGRDGETARLSDEDWVKLGLQTSVTSGTLGRQKGLLDRDATEYAFIEEIARSSDGHLKVLSLMDTKTSGETDLCWGPWLLVQDTRTQFVLTGELWLAPPSLQGCLDQVAAAGISKGYLWVRSQEDQTRSWPLMLPEAGKPVWLTDLVEAITSASVGDELQPAFLTETERAARAEAARKALEAERNNPFKPLLLRRLTEASRW